MRRPQAAADPPLETDHQAKIGSRRFPLRRTVDTSAGTRPDGLMARYSGERCYPRMNLISSALYGWPVSSSAIIDNQGTCLGRIDGDVSHWPVSPFSNSWVIAMFTPLFQSSR